VRKSISGRLTFDGIKSQNKENRREADQRYESYKLELIFAMHKREALKKKQSSREKKNYSLEAKSFWFFFQK
jgi:hypothetical protein